MASLRDGGRLACALGVASTPANGHHCHTRRTEEAHRPIERSLICLGQGQKAAVLGVNGGATALDGSFGRQDRWLRSRGRTARSVMSVSKRICSFLAHGKVYRPRAPHTSVLNDCTWWRFSRPLHGNHGQPYSLPARVHSLFNTHKSAEL